MKAIIFISAILCLTTGITGDTQEDINGLLKMPELRAEMIKWGEDFVKSAVNSLPQKLDFSPAQMMQALAILDTRMPQIPGTVDPIIRVPLPNISFTLFDFVVLKGNISFWNQGFELQGISHDENSEMTPADEAQINLEINLDLSINGGGNMNVTLDLSSAGIELPPMVFTFGDTSAFNLGQIKIGLGLTVASGTDGVAVFKATQFSLTLGVLEVLLENLKVNNEPFLLDEIVALLKTILDDNILPLLPTLLDPLLPGLLQPLIRECKFSDFKDVVGGGVPGASLKCIIIPGEIVPLPPQPDPIDMPRGSGSTSLLLQNVWPLKMLLLFASSYYLIL